MDRQLSASSLSMFETEPSSTVSSAANGDDFEAMMLPSREGLPPMHEERPAGSDGIGTGQQLDSPSPGTGGLVDLLDDDGFVGGGSSPAATHAPAGSNPFFSEAAGGMFDLLGEAVQDGGVAAQAGAPFMGEDAFPAPPPAGAPAASAFEDPFGAAPLVEQAAPPAWVSGAMEPPAGEKDMGSWSAAVYTAEQQERLGVTEEGTPVQSAPVDLKAALHDAFPEACTAGAYAAARAKLRQLGGAEALLAELTRLGYAEEGKLTTGTKPFNVFARVASGAMVQPGMEEETARLGEAQARYVVACNRPENDEHWASDDAEWVGKASMAQRHRFLLVRDLSWSLFNVLALGIEGGDAVRAAVQMLEEMERAARIYAAASDEWSDDVGLYFHIYGHASVNALHLHIVDLAATGPTFDALRYKNLPLADVLEVLRSEVNEASPSPEGVGHAAVSAAGGEVSGGSEGRGEEQPIAADDAPQNGEGGSGAAFPHASAFGASFEPNAEEGDLDEGSSDGFMGMRLASESFIAFGKHVAPFDVSDDMMSGGSTFDNGSFGEEAAGTSGADCGASGFASAPFAADLQGFGGAFETSAFGGDAAATSFPAVSSTNEAAAPSFDALDDDSSPFNGAVSTLRFTSEEDTDATLVGPAVEPAEEHDASAVRRDMASAAAAGDSSSVPSPPGDSSVNTTGNEDSDSYSTSCAAPTEGHAASTMAAASLTSSAQGASTKDPPEGESMPAAARSAELFDTSGDGFAPPSHATGDGKVHTESSASNGLHASFAAAHEGSSFLDAAGDSFATSSGDAGGGGVDDAPAEAVKMSHPKTVADEGFSTSFDAVGEGVSSFFDGAGAPFSSLSASAGSDGVGGAPPEAEDASQLNTVAGEGFSSSFDAAGEASSSFFDGAAGSAPASSVDGAGGDSPMAQEASHPNTEAAEGFSTSFGAAGEGPSFFETIGVGFATSSSNAGATGADKAPAEAEEASRPNTVASEGVSTSSDAAGEGSSFFFDGAAGSILTSPADATFDSVGGAPAEAEEASQLNTVAGEGFSTSFDMAGEGSSSFFDGAEGGFAASSARAGGGEADGAPAEPDKASHTNTEVSEGFPTSFDIAGEVSPTFDGESGSIPTSLSDGGRAGAGSSALEAEEAAQPNTVADEGFSTSFDAGGESSSTFFDNAGAPDPSLPAEAEEAAQPNTVADEGFSTSFDAGGEGSSTFFDSGRAPISGIVPAEAEEASQPNMVADEGFSTSFDAGGESSSTFFDNAGAPNPTLSADAQEASQPNTVADEGLATSFDAAGEGSSTLDDTRVPIPGTSPAEAEDASQPNTVADEGFPTSFDAAGESSSTFFDNAGAPNPTLAADAEEASQPNTVADEGFSTSFDAGGESSSTFFDDARAPVAGTTPAAAEAARPNTVADEGFSTSFDAGGESSSTFFDNAGAPDPSLPAEAEEASQPNTVADEGFSTSFDAGGEGSSTFFDGGRAPDPTLSPEEASPPNTVADEGFSTSFDAAGEGSSTFFDEAAGTAPALSGDDVVHAAPDFTPAAGSVPRSSASAGIDGGSDAPSASEEASQPNSMASEGLFTAFDAPSGVQGAQPSTVASEGFSTSFDMAEEVSSTFFDGARGSVQTSCANAGVDGIGSAPSEAEEASQPNTLASEGFSASFGAAEEGSSTFFDGAGNGFATSNSAFSDANLVAPVDSEEGAQSNTAASDSFATSFDAVGEGFPTSSENVEDGDLTKAPSADEETLKSNTSAEGFSTSFQEADGVSSASFDGPGDAHFTSAGGPGAEGNEVEEAPKPELTAADGSSAFDSAMRGVAVSSALPSESAQPTPDTKLTAPAPSSLEPKPISDVEPSLDSRSPPSSTPPPPPPPPRPPPPPPTAKPVQPLSPPRSPSRKSSRMAEVLSSVTTSRNLEKASEVLFCGWTNKKVMFWWSTKYFALTTNSELYWYDGTPEDLRLGGKLDLRDLASIKRDFPESDDDFTFRVVTPNNSVRLDPGSREAFQKWQEGLMMSVSAPSPLR